jgi:hypothetical protein
LGDAGGGGDLVAGVVVAGDFAEPEDAAVVLGDFDDGAFVVVDGDCVAVGPEVEAVYGFALAAPCIAADDAVSVTALRDPVDRAELVLVFTPPGIVTKSQVR